MSSQDFPTYGRDEQPEQQGPGEEQHFAPPTPYGGGTYGAGNAPQPDQFPYAEPQPYGTQQPPAPGNPRTTSPRPTAPVHRTALRRALSRMSSRRTAARSTRVTLVPLGS